MSQDRSCGTCHEDVRVKERGSVHAGSRIGCAECHGGDPRATEKAAAHGARVKKVRPRDIPVMCGACHADVRRMNPFGLATDQLAQYRTSHHGEKLAEGNEDVAGCASCHGVHGVKRVKDPTSPVYPKNVPATCGRCHSDKKLMARHDLKATAERDYRKSPHAALLFEKSDLSAPTCATCHGNHGAVPPGFRQIPQVCGKCHVKQRDLFAKSPHAKEGDFPGCVACHTNHNVLRKADDIETRCRKCHEKDGKEIRLFARIARLMKTGEVRFDAVKARADRLTREGHHTDDELLLLEEAKTWRLQLAPVQHTLSVDEVGKVAREEEKVLAEADRRLDEIERKEKLKKQALIPIWGFLVGMALLFAWRRRRYG